MMKASLLLPCYEGRFLLWNFLSAGGRYRCKIEIVLVHLLLQRRFDGFYWNEYMGHLARLYICCVNHGARFLSASY